MEYKPLGLSCELKQLETHAMRLYIITLGHSESVGRRISACIIKDSSIVHLDSLRMTSWAFSETSDKEGE